MTGKDALEYYFLVSKDQMEKTVQYVSGQMPDEIPSRQHGAITATNAVIHMFNQSEAQFYALAYHCLDGDLTTYVREACLYAFLEYELPTVGWHEDQFQSNE